MVETFAHYKALWNLRTTCALLSLDTIQPFWEELGFRGRLGEDLRDASRELLETWWDQERGGAAGGEELASEGIEDWRGRIRQRWGESVAAALIAVSNEVEAPGIANQQHAWTELLTRLQPEIDQGSGPPLPPIKRDALLALAGRLLAASRAAHDRVDRIATATASTWDEVLLRRDFYPGDDPSDRKFDADTWLWKLLTERQWRRFTADLRNSLSSDELQALITWGADRPGNVFGRYLTRSF